MKPIALLSALLLCLSLPGATAAAAGDAAVSSVYEPCWGVVVVNCEEVRCEDYYGPYLPPECHERSCILALLSGCVIYGPLCIYVGSDCFVVVGPDNAILA